MSDRLMMLITDPIKKIDQWYAFSCKIMKTENGGFLFKDTKLTEGCVPEGYYCEPTMHPCGKKVICDELSSGKQEFIPNSDFDMWQEGFKNAPDGWTKPGKLKKKGKTKLNPTNLIY